jgi:hypothetical protein
MIFKVYLMRRGGRRLRSPETINAPACIGEQELTGGQSANLAIWPYGQRSLNSRYLTVNGLSGQRGNEGLLSPSAKSHSRPSIHQLDGPAAVF